MSKHGKDKCKEKCKTDTYNLYYDDFSQGFVPGIPGSPYSYFSGPDFSGNDAAGGVVVVPNSLTVNSTPFTFTAPNNNDNIKYFVYKNQPFNAPMQGEIVFETIMSSQQTGLGGLPDCLSAVNASVSGVNNVNSDMRLADSVFAVLDFASFLFFGFMLTNEDIYVMYEVSPLGKPQFGGPGPDYDAFSSLVPIEKRNVDDPLGDFVKLSIGYNYDQTNIRQITRILRLISSHFT